MRWRRWWWSERRLDVRRSASRLQSLCRAEKIVYLQVINWGCDGPNVLHCVANSFEVADEANQLRPAAGLLPLLYRKSRRDRLPIDSKNEEMRA